MFIGKRIREIRTKKGISQADLERRTGLVRCYISRVECGGTVPALETLERFADGLGVPFYELFYVPDALLPLPHLNGGRTKHGRADDTSSREGRLLVKLAGLSARMTERDRGLVVLMAQKLANGYGSAPVRAKS